MQLNNKKLIISIIALLVVIGTIMVIAITTNRGKYSGSDGKNQTQQSVDVDDKDTDRDDEDSSEEGLQVQDVLDENNKEAGNSTSASGTWDDEKSEADKNLDKKEPVKQTDKVDIDDYNNDRDEKNGDIAESDIIYGNIY